MKRIILILAGLGLLVAALFVLVVALLPRDVLKARIGEQIASWTGRDVSLRGEPEIDLFPALSVTLNDVQVAGPEDMQDAEILSMDRLTGTIRLLPLLIGRVEVGSFTMVRPLIRLVRDGEGHRNWAFDSGAAALQLAFAGDVPLGDFHLLGGTVVYEDRMTGGIERLDSVNVTIDWESVRHPIAIEGSGIWRGEQVAFSASAGAPFAFMNGAPTPVETRIDSAPITMTFSGEARDYPASTFSGALSLTTPSLRRFAGWLGSPIGPGSTLGPASVAGSATLSGNVLAVENAEFTLDGNAAAGALTIAAGARPEISGTLAFTTLDLTSYFAGLSSALSTAKDWRGVELPTSWFGDLDADIRLSSDSVTLGSFAAGDTAASVSLRDRRLEIGLARAVFNGGSLAGNLAILDRPQASEALVEAQVRATDMAFAGAAPLIGLKQAVSGTASASLDVTTAGHDLGTLLGRLGGIARLDIRDGVVPLLGIDELAAGDAAAVPGDPLAPRPVQSVSLGLSFSGGFGVLERAEISTPTYRAELAGQVGLLDGSLGLDGVLRTSALTTQVAAGEGASDAGPDGASDGGLAFAIEGTLTAPIARPLALAN